MTPIISFNLGHERQKQIFIQFHLCRTLSNTIAQYHCTEIEMHSGNKLEPVNTFSSIR